MTIPIKKLATRLRNKENHTPIITKGMSFLRQIRAGDAGITVLETAIILIAFVVVTSVFTFTMLSADIFATERGEEAIDTEHLEAQPAMEIKGSVIALAAAAGTDATVDSLVFTLATASENISENASEEEAINLANGENAVVVIEYRDAKQRVTLTGEDWSVAWLGKHNDNELLEANELAEITIELDALTTPLGTNTTFVLEMKPPSGAILTLQRTTPAWLQAVTDLR